MERALIRNFLYEYMYLLLPSALSMCSMAPYPRPIESISVHLSFCCRLHFDCSFTENKGSNWFSFSKNSRPVELEKSSMPFQPILLGGHWTTDESSHRKDRQWYSCKLGIPKCKCQGKSAWILTVTKGTDVTQLCL